MAEESQDSEARELRRVLIVDPSKVVRSALARHLREHFDVREEADGESAWQSLVLDPTIIAVVSATQLPRLNGLDLLARIRVSKLRRICDIPFLLLVSGSESIEDRLRAQETGVTDFLTRGMSREEILERIGRLVTWEFATNLTDSNIMPTVVQHNAPIATPKTEPQAANVSRLDLRASLDVALAKHATTDGMVGVIAFGLDNAGSLAQTYGQKTLATITKRPMHPRYQDRCHPRPRLVRIADVLERMIRAGVDVVRLNFSHGNRRGSRRPRAAGPRGSRPRRPPGRHPRRPAGPEDPCRQVRRRQDRGWKRRALHPRRRCELGNPERVGLDYKDLPRTSRPATCCCSTTAASS
jgi:CheY-like chemotaxis protein